MRFFIMLVLLLVSAPLVVQAQIGRNRPSDQRALVGTEWRLVTLGPPGSETDVVTGTTVTVRLAEDGRASGSTGCNTYSGTYEVRGDTISFGRLASTRRACLDQNANEQERRFLAALEAANRFRLSSNRLTIISDRGRMMLNFVSPSSSEPDDDPRDDRNDPVATLASYFNAINAKNYRRAFRFWEPAPSSFEQFERGFADVERLRVMVEPAARTEGAAGGTSASVPIIIISTTRFGNERVFAGCYVLRRSNLRDNRWQIYRADVSQFPSSARVSRLVSQGCR